MIQVAALQVLLWATLSMPGASTGLAGGLDALPSPGEAVPRDTSFTLASAAAKIRGRFPGAVPAATGEVRGIQWTRGIVYSSAVGRDLRIDIVRPAGDTSGLLPTVLMFHGGGWRSGERSMEEPMAERLAAAGFAAVTVEYRLSPEALYPAPLADALELLGWIERNGPGVGLDPQALTLYGCSSGGHLASLIAVQDRRRDAPGPPVRAVVNIDGPVDLTDPSESGKDLDPATPSSAARWLGATYAGRPEVWREASPAFRVTPHTPPILFINSGEERYRAGRERMIRDMQRYGIRTSVQVFPGSPHTFWLFHPWQERVAATIVEFLRSVLST